MFSMAAFIDFKALRQSLSFRKILEHYQVDFAEKSGGQAYAFCPLPLHVRKADAPRSPSLSVNLERGIFQCFSCQGAGNLIEFTALMEGVDPKDGTGFRRIALQLDRLFNNGQFDAASKSQPAHDPSRRAGWQAPSSGDSDAPINKIHRRSIFADAADALQQTDQHPTNSEREDAVPTSQTTSQSRGDLFNAAPDNTTNQDAATNNPRLPVQVNPVLAFELKDLDTQHSYLPSRGLTPETIAHFGLGYCSRGLMKNRIVIPLRDEAEQLIGYAGRVVDDTTISADCPRYLLPSSREHKGERLEFRKGLFLYQGYAVDKPVNDLVVVEGFTAYWWLWQHGYRAMVALMGASASSEQIALMVQKTKPKGRIWLMPDGDAAGHQCAAQVLPLLAVHRSVRLIPLDKQPTDLSADELKHCLP
jgi:CHC2 zinc finger/Toprim domain